MSDGGTSVSFRVSRVVARVYQRTRELCLPGSLYGYYQPQIPTELAKIVTRLETSVWAIGYLVGRPRTACSGSG